MKAMLYLDSGVCVCWPVCVAENSAGCS